MAVSVLAPFYDVYQTQDGKYVAVGALEPQFYAALLKGLGLDGDQTLPAQHDVSQWPVLRQRFQQIFRSKSRDQWSAVFDSVDACVTAVLDMDEYATHVHNVARNATIVEENDIVLPAPAPRLSRTPALRDQCNGKLVIGARPLVGEHTREVLHEAGVSQSEIDQLLASNVISASARASL
jgi:alpha-methylacyl-CoA racemase